MFNRFYQQIAGNRLAHWLQDLPSQLNHWQKSQLHGDFKLWQKRLSFLRSNIWTGISQCT